MKNIFIKIVISLLLGLSIAFSFNIVFLKLLHRPLIDQTLLLFFSMAAFGYLIFYIVENLKDISVWWGSLKRISFRELSFKSFFQENLLAILIAVVFLVLYIFIGFQLNIAGTDTVDNFLDADNTSWMARISAPDGEKMEMRGPHPFAYLIFRPPGWLFNLFTNNYVTSAILINTLAGALCLFFVWKLIERQTNNRIYASLITTLTGLSTAQLFFGSVVESYIFSALALIIFFYLLQIENSSLGKLVAVSVITFGITLTNFVQNFIGFIFTRPRLKDLIRFVGLTLSISIILSLLHAAWYSSSKLFFLPSDAQAEEEFTLSLFNEPSWRAIGRVILLIRTILLYTVIAPKPYVFTEEVGGTFPRFNFFKIAPETFSYSSYDGIGTILVIAWMLLLALAGVVFVYEMIRTRKVDIKPAFVLCILFNFALHLNYGYEPFLYSPDWAYALILFVALSLAPLAKNRIFQTGLFAFILLLAVNQWQFLKFMFDTISHFIDR